jgi:hypothetical protein
MFVSVRRQVSFSISLCRVSSEAELVSVELECVKRQVSHKFRFRAIVVSENPDFQGASVELVWVAGGRLQQRNQATRTWRSEMLWNSLKGRSFPAFDFSLGGNWCSAEAKELRFG